MAHSTKRTAKGVNLTIRLDPLARTALQRLAMRERSTQTAVLERLILAAVEDPDSYYLRSAAISSFTAAALARIVLGVVTADHRQLTAALSVVDGVSRGLFGNTPAPPGDVMVSDEPHPRVQAILDAFNLLDQRE